MFMNRSGMFQSQQTVNMQAQFAHILPTVPFTSPRGRMTTDELRRNHKKPLNLHVCSFPFILVTFSDKSQLAFCKATVWLNVISLLWWWNLWISHHMSENYGKNQHSFAAHQHPCLTVNQQLLCYMQYGFIMTDGQEYFVEGNHAQQ